MLLFLDPRIEVDLFPMRADEKNKDKDVTKDVAAFMKYDRAGLDLTIEFCTALTPAALGKWALELTKANMQKKYDDSKYAW